MSFVRMAKAWQESGQRQQDERDREAERERQEREDQIRQAAMLAGLQQQGIVRNEENPTVRTPSMPGIPGMNVPTSRRLGDTGYSQDLTRTPDARERAKEIVARRQQEEQRRVRRAFLQARGVPADQHDAIVDDDEVFQSYAKQQEPKPPRAYAPTTREEYMANQREVAGIQAANRAPSSGGTITDGERKAGAFLFRAKAASVRVNQFDNRQALDEIAGRAGWLGNWAASPQGRQLKQAGRVWAQSVLRAESGAQISDRELEDVFDTYLPRPGDDPGTLEQKRAARAEAEEALRLQAGRAAPAEAKPGAPVKPESSDNIDDIMRRYGLEP